MLKSLRDPVYLGAKNNNNNNQNDNNNYNNNYSNNFNNNKCSFVVSAMAKSRESSVQDKIAEVTECSICVQIFTNPKILPCVHTFCLHCLETYGKDKKPGDQMVCPICRNEFLIPDGGLCKLPNN